MNKVICWDFDGTLHNAKFGYRDGTIYGEPTERSVFTLNNIAKAGYTQIILTSRQPQEWIMVKNWLEKHGFPEMEITNTKPKALAYIDNRAIRFTSMSDLYSYFI